MSTIDDGSLSGNWETVPLSGLNGGNQSCNAAFEIGAIQKCMLYCLLAQYLYTITTIAWRILNWSFICKFTQLRLASEHTGEHHFSPFRIVSASLVPLSLVT